MSDHVSFAVCLLLVGLLLRRYILERQRHGIIYEDSVISRFGLSKATSYTSEFDAFTKNGTPVSIKTKKINCAPELADYFRNARISQDFFLVVGFWSNSKSEISNEVVCYVKCDEWKKQFPEDWEDRIRGLISSASCDRIYDSEWRKERLSLQRDYNAFRKQNGIYIVLRPKRDHKKQIRMQCAIDAFEYRTIFVPRYGVDSSELTWR